MTGVLFLVLIFLCYLLLRQYKYLRTERVSLHEALIDSLYQRAVPSEQDIDSVMPWMTFQYINVVFRLPSNYLKDTLHISNSKYPNMSISKYAKASKLDTSSFIVLLKQSVSSYLARGIYLR